MYGLVWRLLPGPWPSKLIMSLGMIAGAAALLWFVAFPAVSPHMPFNDGAVDATDPGAAPPPAEGAPGGDTPQEDIPGEGAPGEEDASGG